MTGALPLRAGVAPTTDRLAELLAESTTALSQDARSAARLAAEATALTTAASDVAARARARYLEGRAAELALDESAALAAYREALAGFQAVGDDAGRADALRGIGQVYDKLGETYKQNLPIEQARAQAKRLALQLDDQVQREIEKSNETAAQIAAAKAEATALIDTAAA